MKSLAAYLRIASGVEIGTNDFRVSDMGPDGSTLFDSRSPDAAFSSATGEYLVIWQGEDDTELLVDNEFEISVQALNGSNGGQVGANDLRISSMGPDGDTLFGALNPAIAVRGGTGELLAARQGDDDRVGLSEQEFEVFGQRLTPAAPVPPTPTHTPNPATSTPTATPIPPTATTTPTNTQPGPSNTPTRTPTPTNTQPGPTSTPTKTPPPSATAPAGGYLIYLPITIRK